jgi:L-asparaginase II
MTTYHYLPIVELTRGEAVESVHFGAFSIINSRGHLVASNGDSNTTSFLRSSAKPFQALPLIENGGHTHWDFSMREIAIMCASHTGTDEHYKVLASLQAKINVTQDDLLCGIHPPIDAQTRDSLLARGEAPTQNRHNCSGKHSGMLAFARLMDVSIKNYIDIQHPVQVQILKTFSEMCDIDINEIALGIDGCSAPVFAIPLQKAAFGYARLCDPYDLAPERAAACQTITTAMMTYPDMVAGPGMFDTLLMETTRGKILSKGGAEGYQAIGVLPGVIEPGSPGLGIAIKISDGDLQGRARPAVSLEILRQLGAITPDELHALSAFGPKLSIKNWRGLMVGEAYPTFSLQIDAQALSHQSDNTGFSNEQST